MEWRITHEEELKDVARDILAQCTTHDTHATVLTLSGTLGAGKTSLARALARELGIQEHIKSPTFIIESRYVLSHVQWRMLVHIDAYRLESPAQLIPLHFTETLAQPHVLVLIEWPEHIQDAIPGGAHKIAITITDTGRLITLS